MIQKWDVILQKLQYPQSDKIKKIISNGCLKRMNDDLYICQPILGYNTTAYTLRRNVLGKFSCNCQGHNRRGYCSHSNALLTILQAEGKELQGVLF